MRFLVLSDIHGDIATLEKLDEEFAAADAVLFAGDFARFNEPDTGLPVLNTLVKKHETLFSVLGNCDNPEFIKELEKLDISVQGDMVFRDGLVFAGSGGALTFTGNTPNERTDEELVSDLHIVLEQSAENTEQDGTWPNMILLTHQPPKDTVCDLITNGIHVGSQLIRQFIEKTQPLAVITGHIHESAGIDHIGNTIIINPGSLAEGKYAILEVVENQESWEVKKADLYTISEQI